MKEMGLTPEQIPLKAGIFGAEAWSEEMRQDIQNTLGIKAYDIYGLTELSGPGVSFECSEQTGMHINEDHFIAEIIDPNTGEVLPEGTQGELVFTSLTKEAFPLLRYRTRDICVLTRKKCSCGRTFVKMSKPRGRSDDMLIVKGVNVFPSQIETVLLEQGYQANYQISVFLENRAGQLAEIAKILGDNGIDMRAISIAETTDYGVLRLIVDQPQKTTSILLQRGFILSMTPVLVVAVQDHPGGLAPILQLIAEGSIDIEYMYSLFTHKDGKAYMVFRVSDEEKFTALLGQHGIAMVAGEELGIQD